MIIKSKADLGKCYDLISTNFHEAGHVIYGLLHYMNISSVSVFEDKKTKRFNGLTNYDLIENISNIRDPVLKNNRLYAEIGLSYAGLLAEKRHFKIMSGSDKFPLFLRDGSSEDFSSATALYEKYSITEPGEKRYNHKHRIMRAADKELQKHWDAVVLVSHRLFKKKKISASELKELIIKEIDDKDFWKEIFEIHDQLFNNSDALVEKEIRAILGI